MVGAAPVRCFFHILLALLLGAGHVRGHRLSFSMQEVANAWNDFNDTDITSSSVVDSDGTSSCPAVLVKRCRYCPITAGKCNCFRLLYSTKKKSWMGTPCFKKRISTTSKCTSSDSSLLQKTCTLDAKGLKPVQAQLARLTKETEAANSKLPKTKLVETFWDILFFRYNLCLELAVEDGNYEGLNPQGQLADSDFEGFATMQKEESMRNGKTIRDQLKESLQCASQFAEAFDPNHAVVTTRGAGNGLPSLFDYTLTPIVNTGKSKSVAMKTAGEFFRLKSVEKEEIYFWNKSVTAIDGRTKKRVGSTLIEHWLSHPKNTMARIYALVNVRPLDEEPFFFQLMRNVFAEIPDIDSDKTARIYDLKGSGRKCKGKQGDGTSKLELCGLKGEENKEKDFDKRFPEGIAFPSWKASNTFMSFFQNLFADIAVLRHLKIHDYSLVVRLTENAPECPARLNSTESAKVPFDAWEVIHSWEDAPGWEGPGVQLCGMIPATKTSVKLSAVLLDFLQDSTTLHNKLASQASGSKIRYDKYAARIAQYTGKIFRPLVLSGPNEYEEILARRLGRSPQTLYGDGLKALKLKPQLEPNYLKLKL